MYEQTQDEELPTRGKPMPLPLPLPKTGGGEEGYPDQPGKLRSLKLRIVRKKTDITIVAMWAISVTLILIKSHVIYYLQNPTHLSLYYVSPIFTDIDKLLLIITSFIVGLFLADIKSLIFGYFSSMALSFLAGTFYVFLWGMIVRGYESFFQVAYGWEWPLSWALIQTWRFMIPIGLVFSLMGMVAGNATRMIVKP